MAAPNPSGVLKQSIGDPCANALALTVPLDFTANTQYALNLQNYQQNGTFDFVLGIYIDNFANGSQTIVTMSGTNQRIICPANSEGYFPVLAGTSPTTVTFSSAGNVVIQAVLYNFPIPAVVWKP